MRGMTLTEATEVIAYLRGLAFEVADPIELADGSFIVGSRTGEGHPWVHIFDVGDLSVLSLLGLGR